MMPKGLFLIHVFGSNRITEILPGYPDIAGNANWAGSL